MLALLKQVRAKAVIGFVGGSDLPKITEQLAINGQDSKQYRCRCRTSGCAADLFVESSSG